MATLIGRRVWRGSRDEEGHREYKVVHRVKCTPTEGPASILVTPGLPLPGSIWAFGVDIDPWAWCRNVTDMRPVGEIPEGDPITHWDVEHTFSTKPPPVNQQRCNDTQIEDPLLEPPRISGTYTRYQEEAMYDRFGRPVTSSSFELIRGPNNEWDANRPVVRIEQNVSSQFQAITLPSLFADHVNDSPVWNLPPRTVKLTPGPWEKRYYGTCYAYYNRVLEFEIRFDGWDRQLLDEGTKVLSGHWDDSDGSWVLDQINGADPSPDNPSHFKRAIDREGNPMKMILDGNGQPAGAYVESGTFYVSTALANQGNPLGSNSNWRRLRSTSASAWSSTTAYYPGDLVSYIGYLWLANARNKTQAPTLTADSSAPWRFLGVGITSRGTYSPSVSYTAGDYVQAPGLETEAGTVYVERYPQANFFLLGIPSTL